MLGLLVAGGSVTPWATAKPGRPGGGSMLARSTGVNPTGVNKGWWLRSTLNVVCIGLGKTPLVVRNAAFKDTVGVAGGLTIHTGGGVWSWICPHHLHAAL